MSKIDLTDVTFTIPVRIESEDRKNNLRTVVEYMAHHLDTTIMIYEDDKVSKLPACLGPKLMNKVKYIFNKNEEYLFHRTRFLNEMAMKATTPIIVNYDSDLIVEPETYLECAEMIRNEGYEYVIGYSRSINKVPQHAHKGLLESMDPNKAAILPKKMAATDGSPAWFLKEAYINGGMENELFKSWGYEDNERCTRFKKLGLKFGRAHGSLWHLEHARVTNNFNSNPHLGKNRKLHESTSKENKEQCKERVLNTFGWLKRYGVRKQVVDYWKNNGHKLS